MHLPIRHRFHLVSAVLLAALLPLPALAGGTATVQSGQEVTRVSWQAGGAIRINDADDADYMLVRDGKAYAVTMEDGQPQVMELGGMMKAFADAAQQSGQAQALPDKVDSVVATGKSETVAGIRGQVYQVTITDKAGKTKTEEAVLTSDPLVVEMTRTYLNSFHAMFGSDVADKLSAALPKDQPGILRMGTDLALKSISGVEPPAAQFELPAEPISMEQLMKGLSGLMKQKQ